MRIFKKPIINFLYLVLYFLIFFLKFYFLDKFFLKILIKFKNKKKHIIKRILKRNNDNPDFAIYNEIPFVENAIIISTGINIINDWSLSINSFLIAGSKSQAIAEVLPATNIEKKTDKTILFKNFFV